jgi:hypothetical protein
MEPLSLQALSVHRARQRRYVFRKIELPFNDPPR